MVLSHVHATHLNRTEPCRLRNRTRSLQTQSLNSTTVGCDREDRDVICDTVELSLVGAPNVRHVGGSMSLEDITHESKVSWAVCDGAMPTCMQHV